MAKSCLPSIANLRPNPDDAAIVFASDGSAELYVPEHESDDMPQYVMQASRVFVTVLSKRGSDVFVALTEPLFEAMDHEGTAPPDPSLQARAYLFLELAIDSGGLTEEQVGAVREVMDDLWLSMSEAERDRAHSRRGVSKPDLQQ